MGITIDTSWIQNLKHKQLLVCLTSSGYKGLCLGNVAAYVPCSHPIVKVGPHGSVSLSETRKNSYPTLISAIKLSRLALTVGLFANDN